MQHSMIHEKYILLLKDSGYSHYLFNCDDSCPSDEISHQNNHTSGLRQKSSTHQFYLQNTLHTQILQPSVPEPHCVTVIT